MFFFFPYTTDAPVYYWPYATVCLIAINTLIFFGVDPLDVTPDSPWLLAYGAGIRPEQWFGSRFMHAGIGHLLSNMVMLWVMGLVVEGKLGAAKFVPIYLLIAIGQAAVEQAAMLGYQGPVPGSLGASAAIYGIMAMAAIWAPYHGISFWYFLFIFFFIRAGTFVLPVGGVALFFVGTDVLWAVLFGGSAGSSVLHAMGAAVGYPIGLLLLKKKVVDCDGWDLFTRFRATHAPSKKAVAKKKASRERKTLAAEAKQRQTFEDAKQQFDVFLSQGGGGAPLAIYQKFHQPDDGWELDAPRLQTLIHNLQVEKRWEDLAPLLLRLIELEPDRADGLRVSLAQLCAMKLGRPGRAIELLKETDPAALNEKQGQVAAAVTRRARQMQADGIIEFDDTEW